jgi:hypothetical protein
MLNTVASSLFNGGILLQMVVASLMVMPVPSKTVRTYVLVLGDAIRCNTYVRVLRAFHLVWSLGEIVSASMCEERYDVFRSVVAVFLHMLLWRLSTMNKMLHRFGPARG